MDSPEECVEVSDGYSASITSVAGRQFPPLESKLRIHAAALCRRNPVQRSFSERPQLSLEYLARELAGAGEIRRSKFILRCEMPAHTLTLFPDGRAIISGNEDIAEKKSLYAKYVGN